MIDVKRVVTDFGYFCRFLRIPQKQWRKDPYKLGKKAIVLGPLKIAEHQKELIAAIEDESYQQLVVVKSRQQGCTTIVALYMLWCCMYKPGHSSIFIISGDDKAKEFRNILESVYNSLPDELKTKLKFAYNDRVYNYGLNSKIIVVPATINAGRSETFTFGFVDELPYMIPSVQTAVVNGVMASCQKVVIASTPVCESDRFFEMVQIASRENRLFKRDFWDIAESGFYGTKENAEKWWTYLTKGKLRADIEREFLCNFKDAVGDLVLNVPDCCKIPIKRIEYPIVAGIDLGFKDSTYIVFGQLKKGQLQLIDELSFNHTNLGDICASIKAKGYKLKWIAIDSASKRVDLISGISPYDYIRRTLGVPVVSKKPKKNSGDSTGRVIVMNAFYNQHLVYDPERVAELDFMTRQLAFSKTGKIPHTSHLIDVYDALCYLVYNAFGKTVNSRYNRNISNSISSRNRMIRLS